MLPQQYLTAVGKYTADMCNCACTMHILTVSFYKLTSTVFTQHTYMETRLAVDEIKSPLTASASVASWTGSNSYICVSMQVHVGRQLFSDSGKLKIRHGNYFLRVS